MSAVFILGCERSGSTWLLNVLDSCPETECWMEPCAPYAGLVVGLPERFERAENVAVTAKFLRDGVGRLHDCKYALFAQRGGLRRWEDVDRVMLKFTSRLKQRWIGSRSLTADRWNLLHLHEREVPANVRARKAQARMIVIKELRLNFHVAVVARAFPGAKIIVPIRHPLTQVAAIMHQMERGSLGELRQALPAFASLIYDDDRGAKWRDVARACRALDDLPSLLCVWWLVNYDALLSDIACLQTQCFVARHEASADSATALAMDVLRFAGLELGASTKRFLEWSAGGDDSHLALGMRRSQRARAVGNHVRMVGLLERRIHDVVTCARDARVLTPVLEDYLDTLDMGCGAPRVYRMAA